MQALIIGCGYLGLRVARRWREAGVQVAALTRSESRAKDFRSEGIEPFIGNVLDASSLRTLPPADLLLYAVGYDPTAAAAKAEVYIRGLSNVLAETGPRVGGVIYVSSTSVYGQSGGEWIDEKSPCVPTSEGGRICLAAEAVVRRFLDQTAWGTVLRLSGLYGPGRLIARVESLRGGVPIAADPEGWLNLIHGDDAAAVITALAAQRPPAPTWLVSDDRPIHRREFYETMARLMNTPSPRFDRDASPTGRGGRGRGGGGLNKRCSNERLRRELGMHLQFPTIETGLPDALSRSVC